MTIYSHLDLFHLGKNWDIIDCFSNTKIIFIKLIVSQNNSDWNKYFCKKKMSLKKFYSKNQLQVSTFQLVFLDVFVSNNCYNLYLTYVNSITP